MLALKKIAPIHDPMRHQSGFAESASSVIFIPDITGFTKFVQSTDVRHSQHVISGLLESLIDANHLGLDISELEGDAILFYKYADVPSLDELLLLAKQMFENFHHQLNKYVNQTSCHRGSAQTAIDLSLKIIIHRGRLGFTKVKDYHKPHGLDMIVAHKLLKNSVQEKEYILVSDSFENEINAVNSHGFKAEHFHSNKTYYQNIGEVSYRYASLSPLLANIRQPDRRPNHCPMFVSR